MTRHPPRQSGTRKARGDCEAGLSRFDVSAKYHPGRSRCRSVQVCLLAGRGGGGLDDRTGLGPHHKHFQRLRPARQRQPRALRGDEANARAAHASMGRGVRSPRRRGQLRGTWARIDALLREENRSRFTLFTELPSRGPLGRSPGEVTKDRSFGGCARPYSWSSYLWRKGLPMRSHHE